MKEEPYRMPMRGRQMMLRASRVKKKGLQILMAAVMSLTVFPGAVPLYAHDTAEAPDG